MELQYFGTELDRCGHYLWEIDRFGFHRGRVRLEDIPFNPEALPYRKKGEPYQNGRLQYHQFCGFSILAIEGSPKDDRPGSKSIFFVEGDFTEADMMNILRSNPTAQNIIKAMPFEVKWNIKNELA